MRAFVAIELPPSIQNDLHMLQQRVAAALAGTPVRTIRWVPVANLHLTLRFLGETTPAQHAAITAQLRILATATNAFEMTLCDMGCFPNCRHPAVLWLGVAQHDDNRLVTLQRGVERIAAAAGFAPEPRAWKPHLTLARLERGAAPATLAQIGGEFLRATQSASLNPWSRSVAVDQLSFMQSDLRPQGPLYTALDRIALG